MTGGQCCVMLKWITIRGGFSSSITQSSAFLGGYPTHFTRCTLLRFYRRLYATCRASPELMDVNRSLTHEVGKQHIMGGHSCVMLNLLIFRRLLYHSILRIPWNMIYTFHTFYTSVHSHQVFAEQTWKPHTLIS